MLILGRPNCWKDKQLRSHIHHNVQRVSYCPSPKWINLKKNSLTQSAYWNLLFQVNSLNNFDNFNLYFHLNINDIQLADITNHQVKVWTLEYVSGLTVAEKTSQNFLIFIIGIQILCQILNLKCYLCKKSNYLKTLT